MKKYPYSVFVVFITIFCLGFPMIHAKALSSEEILRNYSATSLVGPRDNVPDGAPKESDFKLFAVPVPGILSRSGQPTLKDFQWLKDNGWKSVIDLRVNREKKDISIDTKISGFNKLGFNYLGLPIKDGSTPSVSQVHKFLKFVQDKSNQPAHVHCAAGIGRTGVMVALYRYQIQGWSMNQAIKESALFTKSLPKSQQKWLLKWASNHKSGSGA